MKKENIKKLFINIGSLLMGFINGILGAGGGMIAVPLLKSNGMSQKEAHANSVAIILPLSILSATLYVIQDKVKITDILPYIPSGVIGAILGSFLLKKIPNKILKKIFAVFMIWAGIRILMK